MNFNQSKSVTTIKLCGRSVLVGSNTRTGYRTRDDAYRAAVEAQEILESAGVATNLVFVNKTKKGDMAQCT